MHRMLASFIVVTTRIVATSSNAWPVAAPGPDGAYPNCPCLQNIGAQSLERRFPERVVTQDGKIYITYYEFDDGDTYLPPDFGSSACTAWSASRNPACKQNTDPTWCEDKWCYVDPSNCQRSFEDSDIFPGLSYSHVTCGNVVRYVPASTLNITGPIYAYSFGFEASFQPQASSKYTNMFLYFAAELLPFIGLDLHRLRYREELSLATRKTTSSGYTGCVHDIALGNMDLCIGDIWETQERHEFGKVSFVHIYDEPIYLLARQQSADETFWEMIKKPFRPFEYDLWLLILATIFVVAIAMACFEFHHNDSDFVNKSLRAGFLKSIYLSMTSFVSASVSYNATTTSGRILSVGYGLFILICIASFTAETATFLINRAQIVKHSTIEEVLQERGKICYGSGMTRMVQAKYPQMKSLGVPLDVLDNQLFATLLRNGTCDYALAGELWFAGDWENGEFCDLTFIGSPILNFPTGYWVNTKYERAFWWGAQTLREDGAWGRAEKIFEGASGCSTDEDKRRLSSRQLSSSITLKDIGGMGDAVRGRRLRASGSAAASASAGGEPQHLDASHMLGALCVTVFSLIVAIIVRVCECFACFSPEDKELQVILEQSIENGIHKVENDVVAATRISMTARQNVANHMSNGIHQTPAALIDVECQAEDGQDSGSESANALEDGTSTSRGQPHKEGILLSCRTPVREVCNIDSLETETVPHWCCSVEGPMDGMDQELHEKSYL